MTMKLFAAVLVGVLSVGCVNHLKLKECERNEYMGAVWRKAINLCAKTWC